MLHVISADSLLSVTNHFFRQAVGDRHNFHVFKTSIDLATSNMKVKFEFFRTFSFCPFFKVTVNDTLTIWINLVIHYWKKIVTRKNQTRKNILSIYQGLNLLIFYRKRKVPGKNVNKSVVTSKMNLNSIEALPNKYWLTPYKICCSFNSYRLIGSKPSSKFMCYLSYYLLKYNRCIVNIDSMHKCEHLLCNDFQRIKYRIRSPISRIL